MNTQTVNSLVQAINQLQTCILNMDMNKAGLKHNKSPKHCHNSFKTPQKPSNKSKTHTNNRSKNINHPETRSKDKNICKKTIKLTQNLLLRCEILSKQVTNRNNENFKLGNKSLKEFYHNAEVAILGRRNIEEDNTSKLTPEAKNILMRDLSSITISIHEAGIAQLKHELSIITKSLKQSIAESKNGETIPSIAKGINDFIHTSNFKGTRNDIQPEWITNSDLNADNIVEVAQKCVKNDK